MDMDMGHKSIQHEHKSMINPKNEDTETQGQTT